MLSFENPVAFLFLLVLPIFYILRFFKIFKRTAFPLTFADWQGQSFAWSSKFSGILNFFANLFIVFAYIALIFAFAEPEIHHQEKIYTSKGADILFVLDTSPSMAARDIAGLTRLEAAKQGIHTLVKNNTGASFGLVAMASEAAVIVCPTVDHKLFLQRLDSLVIGELGEGSAIGIGLSSAVYHLVSSKAPKKCIVLITDGENNAGSIHPETATELAIQNDITLYTFGIGTKGAVPIEYVDPQTGKVHSGYYESEFDSTSLEKIAYSSGGRYFGIESTQALAESLAAMGQRENVSQTFYYKSSKKLIYPYFLAFAFVLFVVSWIIRRIILKEIL